MINHRYRAFGLVISSDEPLCSLEPSALTDSLSAPTDVIICRGTVEDVPIVEIVGDLMVGFCDHRTDQMYVRVDEVARFAIGPDRIVVHAEERATSSEVQIYLLGSIIGCLLYMRDRLPFHCNALELDGKAFLFCGASGAGKSTLAGFMEARGHRLLTDDMCALDLSGSSPIAFPGIPRLKLWDDALNVLGRQADRRTPLPWHDHKWELPILHGGQAAVRVAAIYHLRTDADPSTFRVERLTGLNAINSVVSNIYRRRIGELLGRGQAYLSAAVALAQTLPIYAIQREWSLDRFQGDALQIEEHMRGQCG